MPDVRRDRAHLLNLQREARRAWEALLARVPHDRADERGVVYADLSVKDVLAHLAAWDRRAAAQLRALTVGQIVEDTPAGVSWEEFEHSFNEIVRDAWRGRSWPEVQREVHAAYAEFIAADATTATKCDERSEYEDFLKPVRDWLERRS